MQFTDTFRAMDTRVDVAIEAAAPAFAAFASVRLLFARQEQLFSRFREDSLLSALNRGQPVEHARFAAAVRLAFQAFEATDGLFNPMVLPALRQAGYDRTFAEVRSGAPLPQPVPDPRHALSLSGDRVALKQGQLDLGGIVKGWTVDLATELLAGQEGALVNAGGDPRAEGAERGADGWLLAVEAPGGETAWEGAMRGALCTSTTQRRRWQAGGQMAHHLIDPRTGLPAASPFLQVSAWAAEAWRAECWAKAVLVGGQAAAARATASAVRLVAFDERGKVVFSSHPAVPASR